jgi:hypothetical protein
VVSTQSCKEASLETGEFPGTAAGGVRWTLRLEGLAVGLAALVVYSVLGSGWTRFALLILVPDLSMLAYAAGPKIGAAVYNIVHTYIGPLLLAGLGHWFGSAIAPAIAAIWAAHIGFDRALGFGLKYAQGFGFTHLGTMGDRRAGA